jgi:DNA-binding beta-propeller fold protein YncE
MPSHHRKHRRASLAALLLAAFLACVPAEAADTYKWTVQYLIDNSQPVFGQSQKVWPRRNRGLALSPDGKYLYAGYHHGPNGGGEVRKIALSITDDFGRATVHTLAGPLGKSIACDDRGRVYIANEGEVLIYDAELTSMHYSIPLATCEGVAVNREGRELALYATDRELGLLQRYVLDEKGDNVVGAAPAGFDGSGVVSIHDAASLRGVDVDAKGNVWIADHDGGHVFRVSKDGKTIDKVDVPNAMDVAFLGDRVYVTRGKDRLIAVLQQSDLQLLGNLAVPWEELEIAPMGNNRGGALGGIVAIPGKGFYVTNESGQTAGQRSTYGRADDNTEIIGGTLYRDAFNDDNDPILRALEVQGGQ